MRYLFIISNPKSNSLVLDFRCLTMKSNLHSLNNITLKAIPSSIPLSCTDLPFSVPFIFFSYSALSGRSFSKRRLIHLVLCDNLKKEWIMMFNISCWKVTVFVPSWKHIINLYFNCLTKGSLVTWSFTLVINSQRASTYW